MQFTIRQATIEEIIIASHQIPEFDPAYADTVYYDRLVKNKSYSLIAENKGEIAGFKAGYEWNKDTFYTWVGAVLPKYRNSGVARALAEHQEKWAVSQGYSTIRLKTRNYFKAMLIFAIKSGFKIIEVDRRENDDETRIILEKHLA